MEQRLFIVMYHYVRDLANSRYPRIKGLDVALFRQQLDFFEEKFHVVTMEQVIEAVNYGGSLPENALLLTFDDGYIDNFTVVMPLLHARHMQGSFFVPGRVVRENVLLDVNKVHFVLASADELDLMKDILERMDYYRGRGGDDGFSYPGNDELMEKYAVADYWDYKEIIFVKRMLQTVLPEKVRNLIAGELFEKYVGESEEKFARELYMNHDQIRFMRDMGMYMGIHGYGHYWLANMSKEDMQRDIDSALEVMGQYMDTDHWVMNYPYGSYSDTVCEYVCQRGAEIGLTTDIGVARIGTDNEMAFPRVDCIDFPPKSLNYINLS